MTKIADVVVIGAGVIGCSIAYYLAKKGAKVIVIEKGGELCLGASVANQGACPFEFESPEIDGLVRESAKLYDSLSREIEYDVQYQKTWRLICSIDEKRYAEMEERCQNKHRRGLKARLIGGDEIRKLEPALGNEIIVGIEEESAVVNPFKVVYGFAQAARKRGTEFLLATEVKEIEVIKGNIASVVTDRERIRTNFVVNAAGAWSFEIGQLLGLNIPITPQRGQVVVTESLALNDKWRHISDAGYLTTAFKRDQVARSKDSELELGVAATLHQGNEGNWTIGSSREFAGYNNKVTMQVITLIVKRAIKFMPLLKDMNCIRMYAGLRPFCNADGLPILGKVDNPSGFVIAAGHAGEGLTLAPITGKLISELITEDRTSIPIDAFAFSRFKI